MERNSTNTACGGPCGGNNRLNKTKNKKRPLTQFPNPVECFCQWMYSCMVVTGWPPPSSAGECYNSNSNKDSIHIHAIHKERGKAEITLTRENVCGVLFVTVKINPKTTDSKQQHPHIPTHTHTHTSESHTHTHTHTHTGEGPSLSIYKTTAATPQQERHNNNKKEEKGSKKRRSYNI